MSALIARFDRSDPKLFGQVVDWFSDNNLQIGNTRGRIRDIDALMPAKSLYVAFVALDPAGPKYCLIALYNPGLDFLALDGVSIVTFALRFMGGQGYGET